MFHSKISTFYWTFSYVSNNFSGSKNWFFFSRKYALKNWTFFYMTQRIEPSSEHMTFKIWTSFFFSMTQRIEPFFWIRFTELNPFVKYDSKNWTLFFQKKKSTRRIELFKMIQRIELFFSIWLKELKMTQKIEPLFRFNMTDSKNCIFLIWLQKLNPLFEHVSMNWTFFFSMWLKELNPFFLEYDAKNWTFFPWMWSKELNLLFFFENMTQRIETFFFEYDAKNWNFFFLEYDAKNWNFLSWIWRKELNLFPWKWSKEWKLFWKYDSKNWTFFSWIWLKELNSFFVWIMTPRIEPCVKKDSKNGTLFQKMTQRFFFWNMTHTIEHLFMNLFSIWLKELNFFNMIQRLDFYNMTQRIQFLKNKNILTQRIEA